MTTLRPFVFSPNPDTEFSTLRGNGRTGATPDMQKQELEAAGFTGALPDLFKQLSIFGLVVSVTRLQEGGVARTEEDGTTRKTEG